MTPKSNISMFSNGKDICVYDEISNLLQEDSKIRNSKVKFTNYSISSNRSLEKLFYRNTSPCVVIFLITDLLYRCTLQIN